MTQWRFAGGGPATAILARSMSPVVSLNGGSELAHMIKPAGCIAIRIDLELFEKLRDPLCRDLLTTVPMFQR